LDGTVSDDGLPAGAVLSTTWSVQSGPAGAVFADENAVDTTVTFISDGTYVLELTADDTALQGSDTVTIIVEAASVPGNNAPVLGAIGNQSVDEEVELTFTATATDADVPANTLTFSLDAGAPAGASIDPTTGAFSWTPTGAQGPGTYDITVRVTDDGTPSLDASETITVTVNAARAYWTFDTGSGVTVFDTVGSSDGTIFDGADWTTGVSGDPADFALDLDENNGYVAVDENTEALNVTDTSITMTAWILPGNGALGLGGSSVISKMNNAGDGEVFAMIANDYRLRFRLDGVDMISHHIFRLDEWVHVAMVYDGTDKRIYINGLLEEDLQGIPLTQAKTDPIDGSMNAVQLGRRGDGSQFFNGFIDEVQIFKRALSDVEVAGIYAAVTPSNPGGSGLSFTDITETADTSGPDEGGHGVMFAEVNDDLFPDLYLTNIIQQDPPNTSPRSESFFVNNDDGSLFTEEASARGIDDLDGGSHGSVWADLDNDGDYDLFNGSTWDALNPTFGFPENNNVYQNDGTGNFADVTPGIILATEIETRGVTAFDMNGNGRLDLFGVPGPEIPNDVREAYRNDGSFVFTAHAGGDLTNPAIIAMQGVIATDYDGDGDIDILAADRTPNQVPRDFAILNNDGNGNFLKIPSVDLGFDRSAFDGITTADVNNDGHLDVLLSSDGNAHLFISNGAVPPTPPTYARIQTFSDVEGYMGGFADLDNDGWQDLVFAGDERVFINNRDGTFRSGQSVPVSGIEDPRAIAFADIDRDGDLDFAIAAKDSRNWLIRNNIGVGAGNYLTVRLESPSGQAGAFGAKVYVRPAGESTLLGMREAKGAHGYLAQDDPVLHFGLGTVTVVDVFVDFVECTSPTLIQRLAVDTSVTPSITISGDVCPP
jgi:hypothetical protein